MESRRINKQKNLAELVARKVSGELDFEFSFLSIEYASISNELKDIIYRECFDALMSFEVSNTQQKILEEADLEKLSDVMAGKLNSDPLTFNIVTGYGFDPSALTKLYFKSLSAKVTMFVFDMVIGLKFQDIATHDKLKGSKEERKKTILSSFGEQLLLLASHEQHVGLCRDITSRKYNKEETDVSFIHELRKPRSWFERAFLSESNTKTYDNYAQRLFNLTCSVNLLQKLINERILVLKEEQADGNITNKLKEMPLEVSSNIMSFFTKNEQKVLNQLLPCVNRVMAREKKDTIKNYIQTYRK